jgi:hypothetical protein
MFLVLFRIPDDGQNKKKTLILFPYIFLRSALVTLDWHGAVDIASSEAGAEAQWLLYVPPVNEHIFIP